MKKVLTTTILKITFDPNLDTSEDIENKVREEISYIMNRGNLNGCEHGSQVMTWDLQVFSSIEN